MRGGPQAVRATASAFSPPQVLLAPWCAVLPKAPKSQPGQQCPHPRDRYEALSGGVTACPGPMATWHRALDSTCFAPQSLSVP